MAKLDLLKLAKAAGWRNVETKRPYRTLFGTAAKYPLYLTLGTQGIPVRHIVQNSGGSVDEKLVYVYQDMLNAQELEQVVVLEGSGFRAEVLTWFTQRLQDCTTKKLIVLTSATCADWFKTRLGAASQVPPESPLRDLAEIMMCRWPRRTPVLRKLIDSSESVAELEEFGTGNIGEASVTALLEWGCGVDLQCVSRDKLWQPLGVDLLASGLGFGSMPPLRIEAKTDRYATGNMALETISNCTTGTRGWLWTSQADVLAYYFTQTDELFLFDRPRLSAWFAKELENPHPGYAPKKASTFKKGRFQYHTEFYAVPLQTIMREVPSIQTSLTAWLGASPYREAGKAMLLSRMPASFAKQAIAPVVLPAVPK